MSGGSRKRKATDLDSDENDTLSNAKNNNSGQRRSRARSA